MTVAEDLARRIGLEPTVRNRRLETCGVLKDGNEEFGRRAHLRVVLEGEGKRPPLRVKTHV